MLLVFYVLSQYYTLTFKIPAVRCRQGNQVNCSRYQDTGVTDPALVFSGQMNVNNHSVLCVLKSATAVIKGPKIAIRLDK